MYWTLVLFLCLRDRTVRAIIGAIILFLTTFWLVDYIVQLIKHIEEALVKAPVADVLFGTLGLISGLIVAYLILIPIREFTIPVISTVLQGSLLFYLVI